MDVTGKVQEEMTSRQRLATVLSLGQPDRVPVSLYLLNPYDERDWRYHDPTFQEVLKVARQVSDAFGLTYPDGLGLFYSAPGSIPHTVTVREYRGGELIHECSTEGQPPRYGDPTRDITGGEADQTFEETVVETPGGTITSVIRRDRGIDTVWVIKHFVESREDLEAFLSLPYEPPQADASAMLMLDRHLGARGLAGFYMDDPLLPTVDLFGTQAFLDLAVRETERVRDLLNLFQERLLPIYESLCQQVRGAFFRIAGPEYVGVPLMAPRYFREFVVSYDRDLVGIVRRSGNFACIHMHGRLRDNLDHIVEMRPHALEPIECLPYAAADVTLAEVKERIGDQVCLMGNIQEALLDLGTPEEVEAQVRQAIEEGAAGGGFILIPTDTAFTPLSDRKAENLKSFLLAGDRLGRCYSNRGGQTWLSD